MTESPEHGDPPTRTPVEPLRVGLVGAGPWAQLVHAPMLAKHPRTTLAGVWARRPEAARALANRHDAQACPTFEALLARCDAVAFAVPPDVQARLATQAAIAGKTLLLEKPIALGIEQAQHLADAVANAGVGSQLMLTWRYTDRLRSLLSAVADDEPLGGRGWFVSGSVLGGPFATPWRQEHGGLFDLGPHVVDALDAALGTVVHLRAHGAVRGWVGMLLEHATGAVSEVSLSAHAPAEPFGAGIEVATTSRVRNLDMASALDAKVLTTIVDEFVDTAHGRRHPLDVHRGLHLQRLLTQAHEDLGH